jgi:hypothetical protein
VIGGGATILVSGASAQNVRYSGVTDCDIGNGADRPGYGTGVRNQYTDTDTGPNSDPRCRGRGPQAGPTGTGEYGRSQMETMCTDQDRGTGSDPGGRGRRCGNEWPYPRNPNATNRRVCTDADMGANRDPAQQGRHC